MFLTKRIGIGTGLLYVLAQLSGAWVGGALAKSTADPFQLRVTGFGVPSLGVNVTLFRGLAVEAALTFMLVLVIFMVAVDPRAKAPAPLFIGLTVTLGILGGSAISGAGMNPARWMGSAAIGAGFGNSLIYVAAPLIGATLAALIYATLIEERESFATDRSDGLSGT